MRTACLPLLAVLGHKMKAVTRESPTVMEGPHNLDIGSVQILEQQTIIQIMVMNVVQLYNIRREGTYLRNQPFSSITGAQSLIVKYTLLNIMIIWIYRRTNRHQLRLRGTEISAIGDIALPTMLERTQTNGLGNLTRGAPIGCNIDLKKTGHRYFQ